MAAALVAPAVVWTLADAVVFVRSVQPALHAIQWHLALGGSVLNRGESNKDADLYVLPFSDKSRLVDVMPTLSALWGASEPIGYGSSAIYEHKLKFEVNGRRIDVFVVKAPGTTEAF